MGYLGVSGASDRWCRVCRLGWERRWGPGAKVADGERERRGEVMVVAVLCGSWVGEERRACGAVRCVG